MKISAIDIKRLWVADPMDSEVDGELTPEIMAARIASAVEIKNVHQDTWTLDEAEASQDTYKNQLTGSAYRTGARTMGDVTMSFTVGRYDYSLKAFLMGGSVLTEGGSVVGWARGMVGEVKKMVIAFTEDDVFCVLPYASIRAREANTDGAVGIAVVATMVEPPSKNVKPEYWFSKRGEPQPPPQEGWFTLDVSKLDNNEMLQ